MALVHGRGDGSSCEPNKFDLLCDTVNTSVVTLNTSLQEFFGLKDELSKHALPPKLLVQLTLIASKLFRSFSDLCTPVNELVRMVGLYSVAWEEKSEGLKQRQQEQESLKRKLGIALKKIEMMAAEETRIKHERRVMSWERLFIRVMSSSSHGRRWKFRIEPYRKRLEAGYNPFMEESSDESEDEVDEKLQRSTLMEDSSDELKALDSGSETEMLGHTSSTHKQAHIADGHLPGAPSPTTYEAPPLPVETTDVGTATDEPDYDNHLLVQVFRPNGLLHDQDICCTLSVGDEFFASQPFSWNPSQGNLLMHQDFHFSLSDDAARTLSLTAQEPLDSVGIPKLNVAVYARNISGDVVAHLALKLKEISLTETSSVLVPPAERGEPFVVDWDEIADGVQTKPIEYRLKLAGVSEMEETPLIPLICHQVKVQRHRLLHSEANTLPLDDVLIEMGYRAIPELQSRAVSAITLEDDARNKASPSPHPEPEQLAEGNAVNEEDLAAAMMKHADEMKMLQEQYENRLSALSHTLNKVKSEKNRQIDDLEQALLEAEQKKGKKMKSTAELRQMIARKKTFTKVTHGLPEWGKDLPKDFFERLELFADESVRKHEELTERIKTEVREACEKQLATQHKLAPGIRTDVGSATEDVSLPALFMPTPNTKSLVYTPRAHNYFHPPGCNEPRITQPPSVFKLPELHKTHLPTLNLYELSQHFSQSGPHWLKEHSQSPRYTPAPPPSACGFYTQLERPPSVQH